jgi:hypothetical protein
METERFDRLTRTVSHLFTRRALAALGLGATGLPILADAAKKHKRRKKIKRNEFGCVNVGKFCKNGGQCCSGICKGTKGKKTCKAHNASTCQAGQSPIGCGGAEDVPCITSSGTDGRCTTTTGDAGFCWVDGICMPCSKDADCTPICGSQAACIVCGGECTPEGGTACVGPSEDSCAAVNI